MDENRYTSNLLNYIPLEQQWQAWSPCALFLLKYVLLIFYPRPKSENTACDNITVYKR